VVLTRLDAQADVDLTEAVGRRAEELAAVARLFVGVPTRGRGQARALLAHAARAAHTMKLQPILEVESGAASAIALYERSGWRFVGSRTETWIAPNGRPAELRVYLGPA
jgi:ribosomal protein S18 acetylase RimI-like enzyme